MRTLKTVSTLFYGHIIRATKRELPLGGFDVMIDNILISGPFETSREAIEDAKKTILINYPRKFTHEKVN